MQKLSIKYIITLFVLLVTNAYASSIDDQVESSIMSHNMDDKSRMLCTDKLRCSLVLTTQIYETESTNVIWSHNGILSTNANDLIGLLGDAYKEGLNPNDYHIDVINQLVKQVNNQPSNQVIKELGDLDVTLTDAFLLYARHMVNGYVDNHTAYPRWTISKRKVDFADLLWQAVESSSVTKVMSNVTPTYSGYLKLRDKLHDYQKIADGGGWKPIPSGEVLKLGVSGARVELLQKRLALTDGYQLHFFTKNKYDEKLKEAVGKFQANHGLKVTGVVDKVTLQELNIPVEKVIKIIELNMDRLRWLPLQISDNYLLVNIPDFSLNVMQNGQQVLNMPVIVGRRTNQSCVLSSTISYIDINPFWSVPSSIAGKEILPKLQKDPSYTLKEQINVYEGSYDTAPIDPRDIDWKSVDAADMPYKFRQIPGDKNALGHIKFIFPNLCGIYLHDTPTRELFKKNRRDFSHGCIRVGKPLDLAQYMLSENQKWSIGRVESVIASGKRQIVTPVKVIDVEIIYATAWVDENNVLQFRKDLYKIDNINYPIYNPMQHN
jgi:L,D-transpeptidase YcbB